MDAEPGAGGGMLNDQLAPLIRDIPTPLSFLVISRRTMGSLVWVSTPSILEVVACIKSWLQGMEKSLEAVECWLYVETWRRDLCESKVRSLQAARR
jgi:hypothetical protein